MSKVRFSLTMKTTCLIFRRASASWSAAVVGEGEGTEGAAAIDGAGDVGVSETPDGEEAPHPVASNAAASSPAAGFLAKDELSAVAIQRILGQA